MESRALGATSLLVSRLGLGLAALGRPGYINLGHAGDLGSDHDVATMEAHCHRVLDAAWDLGVRYFDAARSYGLAEAFLATWLTARGIGVEVTIGSKWGYTYTAGWKIKADHHEIKEHSLPVLQRQAAESCALLGSHLKLYQIHSATLESGVLTDRGVLEELDRMRASGLHIGLTVSGAHQAQTLRQALDVKVGGRRLFDCVQATWNLLEPSAGPALQAAHDAGLGVIVKEALANGRLTTRNAEPAFASQRMLLEREAARLQTTMDALSLAAVLAQPWADVVLSGAAIEAQLQANVRALGVRWDRAAAECLTTLAEKPDEYWRTRGRLTWN
ncbi:MAG TPA: aldo/keto reductase [Gemmataceae bacterium]|jgi:aryl-alcohol dehydrogenase-like predicted oxidoreductase|nr:aldo/keto reductase [Gemmataceae bacterium]